jgi:adenylylsulfate kinase
VEDKTGGFAIWVTGLPGAGKSTIVRALVAQLTSQAVDVEVLESDILRQILTPRPQFDEEERQNFYRAMVFIGVLLTTHGVCVIFDATANRRAYRDEARKQISKFMEVFVACPLEVCIRRDPKGIYQKAREGAAKLVPGLQVPYEAPEHPDVTIRADVETPEASAQKIVSKLTEKNFIQRGF